MKTLSFGVDGGSRGSVTLREPGVGVSVDDVWWLSRFSICDEASDIMK